MNRNNLCLIIVALCVHLAGYNLWPIMWHDFYYQAQAVQMLAIGCLLINLSASAPIVIHKGIRIWFAWQFIELINEATAITPVLSDLLHLEPTKVRILEYVLAAIAAAIVITGKEKLIKLVSSRYFIITLYALILIYLFLI